MTNEAPHPICEETRDLIPAYALEALEPVEAERVQNHVATCASCASLLEEYHRVTDELLVPETTPATETKPVLDPATPSWLVPLVRLGRRLNRPERQWSLAAVSVTLVLLVAVLGTNLYWAVVTSALHSEQEKLTTLVDGQQAVLDAVATGGRVVSLRGGESSPSASGTLAVYADGERAMLVVAGLPRQRTGTVYQLWLIRGTERDSGGLFTVDKEGRALVQIESAQPLDAYDRAGVTLEPAGGSPGPTSPPAMGGTL
jgi:anti-sigma-K factor RskA